jgi:hypothetical protein
MVDCAPDPGHGIPHPGKQGRLVKMPRVRTKKHLGRLGIAMTARDQQPTKRFREPQLAAQSRHGQGIWQHRKGPAALN